MVSLVDVGLGPVVWSRVALDEAPLQLSCGLSLSWQHGKMEYNAATKPSIHLEI